MSSDSSWTSNPTRPFISACKSEPCKLQLFAALSKHTPDLSQYTLLAGCKNFILDTIVTSAELSSWDSIQEIFITLGGVLKKLELQFHKAVSNDRED